MKGSRSQNNKQSKQDMGHKPKPEIRDNLDSRKEMESTQATTGQKNKKSKNS